jgi:hypothetical protein
MSQVVRCCVSTFCDYNPDLLLRLRLGDGIPPLPYIFFWHAQGQLYCYFKHIAVFMLFIWEHTLQLLEGYPVIVLTAQVRGTDTICLVWVTHSWIDSGFNMPRGCNHYIFISVLFH